MSPVASWSPTQSSAHREQRQWLSAIEVDQLLRAYQIPCVATYPARDALAAQQAAAHLGQACALKILSRDISHKSDVGGVALNLATPEDVYREAQAMQARIRQAQPDARLDGFIVQAMISRPHARELIIGFHEDPQFGAVMLFGQGGVGVEVIKDYALEFPPLNAALAQGMITRTRINNLLHAFRDRPAANSAGIVDTLIKVSQLITDCPDITELDVNPLLADEQGVIALDARIRIAPAKATGSARFAIRPYPRELERCIDLSTLPHILLRPIRPEDAQALEQFFAQVPSEEIQLRLLASIKHLPHVLAARLSQIDYDREMALIATITNGSTVKIAGAVRMASDPDMQRAEFALLIGKEFQHRGLGSTVLQSIIDYARGRGIKELFADVLRSNTSMLAIVRRLGFVIRDSDVDPRLVNVVYPLS